ncbi:MAG: hypothetical protein EAZ65_03685 [Verrucomicrobia bacterium]|nr:MAG: hypothetical protein EAZ84_02930 [Verrucomicrobiota bacterium]TAE88474.1 MAG: hypothetical protein EAZ82_04370 [Verrucomicrobiota bacterium]TAF26929.1 MAG: hypothetical protein EAZ71_03685 [Verrucomicrobiota bacterium]TAF42185.1 MAG: hypothetical protein EAZ65_03685 [Verrucomicrobiota bacterium]
MIAGGVSMPGIEHFWRLARAEWFLSMVRIICLGGKFVNCVVLSMRHRLCLLYVRGGAHGRN